MQRPRKFFSSANNSDRGQNGVLLILSSRVPSSRIASHPTESRGAPAIGLVSSQFVLPVTGLNSPSDFDFETKTERPKHPSLIPKFEMHNKC